MRGAGEAKREAGLFHRLLRFFRISYGVHILPINKSGRTYTAVDGKGAVESVLRRYLRCVSTSKPCTVK